MEGEVVLPHEAGPQNAPQKTEDHMSGDIRYFEPYSLVEVTTVTLGNLFLMRPSPEVNEIILGVFGKAQRKYDMMVCDLKVMSSHYHLLTRPRDANHLGRFMCFVNTNLSKELGKLHRIRGPKFERPYHAVPVSDEEEAQVDRQKYLISNGVKENLVERPEQWPGVQGVTASIAGKPLEGRWYNRTREHAERQRGEEVDAEALATDEVLVLSPLPCWAHLTDEKIQERVMELALQVTEEAALERKLTGREVLGVEAILAMDPLSSPATVERSPKPRFHAYRPAVWKEMWLAYALVLAAFRDAAERLREGGSEVVFPEGTHPPGLPFGPFSWRGQPA